MKEESLSSHLFKAAQALRERDDELQRIETQLVLHNRVTPGDLVVLFTTLERLIRINSNILTMQGTYIETYERAVEERVNGDADRPLEREIEKLRRQLKAERSLSIFGRLRRSLLS